MQCILFLHSLTIVIIPPEVVADLQRPRTPAPVRTWMQTPPLWLMIQTPTLSRDPTLHHLGAGEHEALLLMQEGVAPLFVTDDRSAYRAALARGTPVMRALRILEIAAEQGLVTCQPPLLAYELLSFTCLKILSRICLLMTPPAKRQPRRDPPKPRRPKHGHCPTWVRWASHCATRSGAAPWPSVLMAA